MTDEADYPNPGVNQPPADELYKVRAEIARLQERESELKALMISDAEARSGKAYVAIVKTVVRNQVDITELREAYPAQVAEHTHKVSSVRVELRGINDDGEIVSLRRKEPVA